MLDQERSVGNYVEEEGSSLRITNDQRARMVGLMQGLNTQKRWGLETLFLAISIADRFLRHRADQKKRAPCAVLLAVTSLLLAAKLNEAVRPAFVVMNRLLHADFNVSVTKRDFLYLEREIVVALEFSMHDVTPLAFLGRFQRVFDLDRETEDDAAKYVGNLARDYCLLMQRDASFLQFMPSQIAAASITLAIKTHYDRKVLNVVMGHDRTQYQLYDVMKMWTPEIQ